MVAPPKPPSLPPVENWLPANYHLDLTALELGALAGIIYSHRMLHRELNDQFVVRVKGREEPMLMIDRLLEKVEAAIKEEP